MANKRVSELAQITVPEIDFADLLLISDVTAHESKKLTLGDLTTFLLNDGFLTGSIHGTASYAFSSSNAAYANMASIGIQSLPFLPTGPGPFQAMMHVDGDGAFYQSGVALDQTNNVYGNLQGTASQAVNSKFAVTASYIASSVLNVFSASFAGNAQSASYLVYDPSVSNGTASFAIMALSMSSPQVSGSYSVTSSYTPYADLAAQAVNSYNADTASVVQTASYLAFNGIPNGTASYALFAAAVPNIRQDYGTFVATTQSIYVAQLDMVSVTPTFGGQQVTSFDVRGTLDIPFSSSNSANGKIEMFVLDRATGYSQSIDYSPVFINLGPSSTVVSGTMRFPFTLRGEAPLYGLYKVYVTASYNEVYFDTGRPMKYKITSTSDQLSVQSAEPIIFSSYPNNAIMLYSSSLHPGVAYQGSASQVIYSGSQYVTNLTIPPSSVNVLYYTWTLNGLVTMSVDNNSGLTDLGGIPTSCISMSAANCSLTSLPDMSVGSLRYLNVPNNTIVADLSLPPSMSYLNVANSFYVNLPQTMPYGMTVLVADGTGILYTPYNIPDTLQTMSFANCSNLTSWLAPSLPLSLKYWNSNNTPLSNFPSAMPAGVVYLNVTNNSLPPVTIGNIAQGLVTNGLNNGYLAFYNNPASESAFNITTNVNTLISRGWTVIS